MISHKPARSERSRTASRPARSVWRSGATPEGAADALKEARCTQRPNVSGEREAEARGRHQRQPGKNGALGSKPGRRETRGNRADQRPRRVGRDEDARAALREVVFVREVGKQ